MLTRNFFFDKGEGKIFAAPWWKNPKCSVKHKSHITKVIFLYPVARPRFYTSLNAWWDGKLGIWSIGDWELAQRKSKNRPKGMPVWKNKIMTKEVYRDLLIMKLIPAIMERWPLSDRNSRKIFIRQDGAKNHIHEDNKLFNAALEENGVNAELYTQSATSPDVNLLDLGFFRAIQSFNDAALRNEEELIKAVGEAHENYPKEKINQTWLTLQRCFNQIIAHHGDNDYKIDHISKEKLERNGNLPDVIDVVDDTEDLLDPYSTDEDESESEMTYFYT